LSFTCQLFGVNRQVYYRNITRKQLRYYQTEEVVAMTLDIRRSMPIIGGKKLYYLLFDKLQNLGIGRDIYFKILRANHLLVVPKRKYHVTTNSMHRFKKHDNLILNISINRPNQVWVSDITYIGKRDKPRYLSLVTDAYSKKIMGYNISDNLNAESSVKALDMAIKERGTSFRSLIHHSDRGLQYCSDKYQEKLNLSGILCSMTQNSDPYENAVAERVNGILKQEFKIDQYDLDLKDMEILVKQSVNTYNHKRPHWSNYLLTPFEMHQQSNVKMKTYKKNSSNNEVTTV
jgi:putative transposase